MEIVEQKQERQQLPRRVALVKAFPMPGHKRRWCGAEHWVIDTNKGPGRRPDKNPDGSPYLHALPWPDTEIRVEIVDTPEPFDPHSNGAIPTQVSPRTLKALQRDHRIAVHVVDGDGNASADPAEVVRVAAELAEREDEIRKARREVADAQERAADEHRRYQHVLAATEKRAGDANRNVVELEAEVARLKAELADRKAKK